MCLYELSLCYVFNTFVYLYIYIYIYREERVLEKKCVYHFQSTIHVVISQIVLTVLVLKALLHLL